jgi:hypothetical protein
MRFNGYTTTRMPILTTVARFLLTNKDALVRLTGHDTFTLEAFQLMHLVIGNFE